MPARLLPWNMPFPALLLATGIFSALVLAAALVGQYGFGLYPCDLCIKQRYPYVAVILLAAVGCFLRGPRAQFRLLLLIAAVFAANAGLAFYHSGVEQRWFPGPSACAAGSGGDMTLEEMRRQIMEAPLVSCDQAMATIGGLSLAAWNFVAAALAAGVTLGAAVALRRRQPA